MANSDFHFYMDQSMFDRLNPINQQIIIRLKDDRGEHNGIFLPLKLNPLVPDKGVVIKVSDDRTEKDIIVGSKVVFEKYMGKKIFTENETYLILNEEYILAILPDDADVGIKYDCKL